MLTADKTKVKSGKSKSSSKKSISSSTVEVADYRHKDEKRKNIPDAGLAIYNFKSQEPVKYNYDPHLDPQLTWAGKAEHPSFEVETFSLHIHERVSTQAILKSVQKAKQYHQLRLFAEPDLPLNKRMEFYQHNMEWTNRIILGDSLLVMNSLLERELMAGSVQMIYVDPPYGIEYNSNFQPLIGKVNVQDGKDDSLTREPEQIKAYRDTWELGIHSYLAYLRDRLALCKELLTPSGSIFIQIGDKHVHHVREILDEIFGPINFVSLITFRKKNMPFGKGSRLLERMSDYILWYAKDIEQMKYSRLFVTHNIEGASRWTHVQLPDGTSRKLTTAEWKNHSLLPKGSRVYCHEVLKPSGFTSKQIYEVEFEGRKYRPPYGGGWATSPEGMKNLIAAGRIGAENDNLRYKLFFDDFPVSPLTNLWSDTSGASNKQYVVQTMNKVIQRCMLMTTEPGDLVFDPTCGSGTTAHVAEQWGRRWITCDTSRVAIAIARQRLMTTMYEYYELQRPAEGVRAGFRYKTVPHMTMGSVANKEQPPEEVLLDQPFNDRSKIRVSGPFTVEAIPAPTVQAQSIKPAQPSTTVVVDYVDVTIDLLQKSGVTFPGGKHMTIENLRPTASASFVHAEGEAKQNGDKIRVAVSLGPRYGPITAKQVDEAIRSAYKMGFDVLIFAGFAFDTEAQATIHKNPIPKLSVQMAHISPDVIVGAYSDSPLLKTTKSSQLFTVFGEPDVTLEKKKDEFRVKLLGVDLYDPTTGEIHSSDASQVPAWFLDEDYDDYTFRICQAFFPKEATATNPWDRLENALRGAVDKEKMETFRGTESLPFKTGEQKQIAVKVIDIRGNEVMVVKSLNGNEMT